MSIQAMAWAIKARVGDLGAKVLLISICNYADDDGKCWPKQETLAFDTEMSKRSVQRKLGELQEAGFIRIEERRRPDGTQTSSMIFVSECQAVTLSQSDKNDDSRVTLLSTHNEPSVVEPKERKKDAAKAALVELFPPEIKQTKPQKENMAPDAVLFREGREILGDNAGGMVKNLLKAKQGNIAEARAALIVAGSKDNPREYVGGIIKGREAKAGRDFYDSAGGYGDDHW